MIVVRDTFQVKFGRIREATEAWKQGLAIAKQHGLGPKNGRLMTDFIGGSYYTLVLETTFESLTEYEKEMQGTLGSQQWRDWYQKFVPLIDSGRREIFKIVDM